MVIPVLVGLIQSLEGQVKEKAEKEEVASSFSCLTTQAGTTHLLQPLS